LAPESALVVRAPASDPLRARLARGAVSVEHHGPGSWCVTTADGDIEIARGALSVSHRAEGGVLVALREGAAWVRAGGAGRRGLVGGVEVLLRAGEGIEPPTGAAAAAGGEPRTTLPPSAAPGATASRAPLQAGAVDGQVKDAVSLAPLADFRI